MAINIEELIGKKVARYRTAARISQDELSSRMRGRGFSWTKMTVYNVERGARQLRLSEASELLECMGYSPEKHLPRLLALSRDDQYMRLIGRLNTLSNLICAAGAEINRCIEILQKSKESGEPPRDGFLVPVPRKGEEKAGPSKEVLEAIDAALDGASEQAIVDKLKKGLHGKRFTTAQEEFYDANLDDSIPYAYLLLEELEYVHHQGRLSSF